MVRAGSAGGTPRSHSLRTRQPVRNQVLRALGRRRFTPSRVAPSSTIQLPLVGPLPEPTSIHWHGLRLPAPMDGTKLVQRLVQPGDAFDYRFELPDATVERWRIVNACSARYVRLSLGGRPFRIIGGDGGLRTDALTVDEMLLAPAKRVELAVGPFEDEGAEIAIESLPYRRTSMKRPRRGRWDMLRVNLSHQHVRGRCWERCVWWSGESVVPPR